MDIQECRMVLVEDGKFELWWECSECSSDFKATDAFERKKKCPACGAKIAEWWSLYDD